VSGAPREAAGPGARLAAVRREAPGETEGRRAAAADFAAARDRLGRTTQESP
jgi:hypothetical protein